MSEETADVVSHPEKLLFPDDGITKRDLAGYFAKVAEPLLTHASARPLTLRRFPDGIGDDGFFQQRGGKSVSDALPRIRAATADGADEIEHLSLDAADQLAILANMAVIEVHGWLASAPALQCPDRLIFDLDPSGDDFGAVKTAARQVAEVMDELGLTPHLSTTGSRGLHVIAPLESLLEFDAVRARAKAIAERLKARYPKTLTTAARKEKRDGKLYLDIMRNAYGQTAVLPYSPRAKPGAPVATPLEWDELGSLDSSAAYDIRAIPRRLGQKGDPWARIDDHAADPERLPSP